MGKRDVDLGALGLVVTLAFSFPPEVFWRCVGVRPCTAFELIGILKGGQTGARAPKLRITCFDWDRRGKY